MKEWVRWILVLSFLLLPLAGIYFCLGSEAGLRGLVALSNHLCAGRLTINTVSGSLLGAFKVQGIRYADNMDSVVIDTLTVKWTPAKLLQKQLQIESIHTPEVRVTLGPSGQETIDLPPFSSPLNVLIKEISAEQVSISSEQEEMLLVRTGTINQLSFKGQTLAMNNLTLSTEGTTVQAKGQLQTIAGYPLQLALESQFHPAGYQPFSATGTLNGPLNALALDAHYPSPFPVHLHGQINDLLGKTTWKARLEGKEVSLRKIHKDWPDHLFSNVVIDGKGTLEEYTLHLDSSAVMQQLKHSGQLSADIQGNFDRLQIENVRFVHGKATLSGKGALDWSPTLSWRVEATGTHLDPSLLLADWPGDFSCTLTSTGRFIGNDLEASFHLPQLQGTLRSFPLTGKGEVTLKGKQLQIPQFLVTSAGSTLRITGKTTETVDLSLQLDSNNLAELWPNARGAIHAQGRLTGSPAKPEIALKLTGSNVGLGRDGIGKLTLETKGELSEDGRLDATVKTEQVQFAGTALSLSQVHFQGSKNDHLLTVEMQNTKISAGFQLHGKTIDQGWQGTLRQTHLSSSQFGKWQQRQDAPLSLATQKIEIKPFCLISSSSSICLNGSWLKAPGTWQLHGAVSSLPIGLLSEALNTPWPIEGQLNGALDLTGQQSQILTGKLSGDSAGMVMHFPVREGAEQTVQWRKNRFRADYANNQLQTVLDSELTDNSMLHMDLHLANLRIPGTDIMHIPLQGAVQLQMQDLSPLAVLTDEMVHLSGALQGQFTVKGTPAAPLVTGQMELAKGQAEILPLGITLSPLTLTMKGDTNRLQLLATAHSGTGDLRAESMLNLGQADLSTHTVLLTGEGFKVVHLPGLDLDISPDLQLIVGKKRTDIRGTVNIPKARITSIDFYNSTAPSSDVVVIDDEQEPASPITQIPLFTSVTVLAGDDVQIDAYGLRGAIIGKLQVLGQPERQYVGNGTLSVQNGSFTLYGKRLKIDLGRLLFAGGPLTNPGIELRSENKNDKMTTGVIISGFLQHPEMAFYSNPSMEQSAIISNLLKNTAIGGETRQDTGFIGKVATKTGLGGMVPYLQSVKKLSMIDEIKLETGNKFESFSLIFGSWLTSKFYVSYGKNLLNESGSFNTRYTLGKGFYFMTETGASQSGGDIKYEFEN
jgi:translocation and assembly module TamB